MKRLILHSLFNMLILAPFVLGAGETDPFIRLSNIELVNVRPYDAIVKIFAVAKQQHPDSVAPVFVYVGDTARNENLVSAKLEKVPLSEAVKIICKASRMDFEMVGNAIVVRTPESSTKLHRVELFLFRKGFTVLNIRISDENSASALVKALEELSPDYFKGIKIRSIQESNILIFEGRDDQVSSALAIMMLTEQGILDKIRSLPRTESHE